MLAISHTLSACLASGQMYRHSVPRSRTQSLSRFSSRQVACDSYANDYTSSQEYKDENPSFDDMVLDDEYFASMGLNREEFTKNLASSVSDIDPEGMNLTPEMFAELSGSSNADFVRNQASGTDIWGPEAIILAGFKSEESAMIRGSLDLAHAVRVKVLPCTHDMLHMPLLDALEEPEVEWSIARPETQGRGREWGSQRTVLLSGMSGEDAAAVVQVLEDTGLPPLCVAMARRVDGERPLGEVLTEAVKGQRDAKALKRDTWNVPDHVVSQLPDLQELIGEQARQRLKFLQEQGEMEAEPDDDEQDMSTFGPDAFREAAAGETDLSKLKDQTPVSAFDGAADNLQEGLDAEEDSFNLDPEIDSMVKSELDEESREAADDDVDDEGEEEAEGQEMDMFDVLKNLKRMRRENAESDEDSDEEDQLNDFPDEEYPADIQHQLMADSYDQLFGTASSSAPRMTPQQVQAALHSRTVAAGTNALRRYKTEIKQGLKQGPSQQPASRQSQRQATPTAPQHSQNGAAQGQSPSGSAGSSAAAAGRSGTAALAEASVMLDDIVARTMGGQQSAQMPQAAPKQPQPASQGQVQATLAKLAAQAAQQRQQQQQQKEQLEQQRKEQLEQKQKQQLEQQQKQQQQQQQSQASAVSQPQTQSTAATNGSLQQSAANTKPKRPIGQAYLASQKSVKDTLRKLSLSAEQQRKLKLQNGQSAAEQSGSPVSINLSSAKKNGAAKGAQLQNGSQRPERPPRPVKGLRLNRSAVKQVRDQKLKKQISQLRASAAEAQQQQQEQQLEQQDQQQQQIRERQQQQQAARDHQRDKRQAARDTGGVADLMPDYELDPDTGDVKWRVVREDFMTVEQMHKDLRSEEDRPAWASPSGRGAEPNELDNVADEMQPTEADANASSESKPMTRKELQAFASKRGVDIDRLVEDMKARGISISD